MTPTYPQQTGPTLAGAKAEGSSIQIAAELGILLRRECAVGGENVDCVPLNVQRAIR